MHKDEWTAVSRTIFRRLFGSMGQYKIFCGGREVVGLYETGADPVILFCGATEYDALYDFAPNDFSVYIRDDDVW